LPEHLLIEVEGSTYLYITSPMKLIKEREILPKEKLQMSQKTMATWDQYPEFALVDRFYGNAKHSIETENFISAIIELQTSFEIFIRNTVRLIVKTDGKREKWPEAKIQQELQKKKNVPFRNVIEQHLSKKINEKINIKEHPVIKKWYINLYVIRNDIVHSGKYFVTNEEAQNAYNSYVEVRGYITDKLVTKGYLSKEGTVNLKFFEDVYSNPQIQEDMWEKLREYKLIPEDIDIIEKT
jgi:hypothetical protein